MAAPLLAALGRAAAGAGRAAGSSSGAVGSVAQAGFNLQGIQALGDSFKGLAGSVLGAVNPVNQFTAGMNAFTAPVRGVVSSFGSMRDSVAALGIATSEFVRLSDPMAVKRFSLAYADASASIGRAIAPVQEFGTALVGGFRDVMWKASGPIQKLLGKVFDPLTEGIPKLVDAAAPLLRIGGRVADVIGSVFEALGRGGTEGTLNTLQSAFETLEDVMAPLLDVAQALAMVFGDLMAETAKWSKALMEVLGISGKPKTHEKVAGGGVGAAVVNAGLGSVDSYIGTAWKNAFQTGTGAKRPEETTANTVELIYKYLQDLPNKMWNEFSGMAGAIAAALGEVLKALIPGGRAVWDAAKEAGRRLVPGERDTTTGWLGAAAGLAAGAITP